MLFQLLCGLIWVLKETHHIIVYVSKITSHFSDLLWNFDNVFTKLLSHLQGVTWSVLIQVWKTKGCAQALDLPFRWSELVEFQFENNKDIHTSIIQLLLYHVVCSFKCDCIDVVVIFVKIL